MDYELVFRITSFLPVPCWLLMIFSPRGKWTRSLIENQYLSLVLALVYSFLVIAHFGASEGDFNSLHGVQTLFQNPEALLAGWIHYLAFDFIVGGWILTDSQKSKMSHAWVVPSLILTFIFGPMGLLVYRVFKFVNMARK